VFETTQFRLVKLMALAPVTDEMLEDAIGFESWIGQGAGSDGAGHQYRHRLRHRRRQPLGILKAAPSGTWFRLRRKPRSRRHGVVRQHQQDVVAHVCAVAPQCGVADQPGHRAVAAWHGVPGHGRVLDAPRHLGRAGLSADERSVRFALCDPDGPPGVPVQACKTVGDQGDIILVDLNQYWVLTKAAGIRTDTSIHLYFDQASRRSVHLPHQRPAGMWSSAITPQNGSNTLSWAVVARRALMSAAG
jgi:hypothetical protein